jgi:two-component sensor histidine kinase
MVTTDTAHFLDGDGRMADAIRAYDWASSPLGSLDAWPASLKIAVELMLASAFPQCIVWGPELITLYNDAFRPILGEKPEALGRSFRSVWHEAWDYIGPIAERAYAGKATFIENFPLVIDRHGYSEQAYFTFCYSPIRDETGRIAGMIDTVIETTGTVQAEQNAQHLNAELTHRIKNTLTMVGAIADQTFQSARSKEDAQAILMKRIVALGHAQTVLSQSSWNGASIRTVIEGALSPHRSGQGQISIKGPPLNLSAKQSLSLALAINELATNALKYGALSVAWGRVSITWHIGTPETDETFRLVWAERDGPVVSEPAHRGFGSRLIERSLAEDFGGEVRITYDPGGILCELTTRMSNLHIVPETDLEG